jgi:hypothetical protein
MPSEVPEGELHPEVVRLAEEKLTLKLLEDVPLGRGRVRIEICDRRLKGTTLRVLADPPLTEQESRLLQEWLQRNLGVEYRPSIWERVSSEDGQEGRLDPSEQ